MFVETEIILESKRVKVNRRSRKVITEGKN